MNDQDFLIDKDLFQHVDSVFLAFQDPRERRYYKVAELKMENNESSRCSFSLTYFDKNEDYKEACKKGFEGYPGFPLRSEIYKDIDIMILSCRIMRKNRGDFGRFLKFWRVDEKLKEALSPFDLLTLTEGKNPKDFFSFYPVWKKVNTKMSFISLIQGFRYQKDFSQKDLKINGLLDITEETSNKLDDYVYKFSYKNKKLGYVSRIMREQVKSWLESGYKLSGKIATLNGEEIPKVYANIIVEKK